MTKRPARCGPFLLSCKAGAAINCCAAAPLRFAFASHSAISGRLVRMRQQIAHHIEQFALGGFQVQHRRLAIQHGADAPQAVAVVPLERRQDLFDKPAIQRRVSAYPHIEPVEPVPPIIGRLEVWIDHLTGGKSSPAPEGSTLPEGSRVGENGIILRPGKEGTGPRIDIPANGEKPRETLDYLKPQPDEYDIRKLRAYGSHLEYRHGVFIRFLVGQDQSGVSKATFIYPLD